MTMGFVIRQLTGIKIVEPTLGAAKSRKVKCRPRRHDRRIAQATTAVDRHNNNNKRRVLVVTVDFPAVNNKRVVEALEVVEAHDEEDPATAKALIADHYKKIAVAQHPVSTSPTRGVNRGYPLENPVIG
jgi:2-phospho-L-lactate guanylyltransferase (CobY/MobA/RfbA family)